ncbi:MAG: PIG-L family deacetylase [Actinomycetota bacterium]
MSQEAPLCILTVHAHPDDEASKGAPTMARYKAEGARTVLVCCTGGEEGDLQNPSLREPGGPFHGLSEQEEKVRLAELRPLELEESARIIGFDKVVMLDYRDSGMKDSAANEHPDCFHQATLDDAAGRLVAVLRRERPHVVLTYSDDQRGYPHPDHVRVHEASVLAFERAGDAAWYPDAGEPWQPLKLYYTVWSKARLVAVRPAEIKPDHVYYRFSAAKNRHVWSKAVGQGRFRYAMGPGSVQPARLFDIRATEEEKQKALESRAPLAAKLYASQGAQPALRLDDADRWSVAIVPTDGSVFDVETGRRFEWHGDRAVEVAHSGGNSWTRRGDRYAPARPDPISMDPIPACW